MSPVEASPTGPDLSSRATGPEGASPADSRRALGILARSLFRQMREQGYSPEQIVALSSELLELVSHDLRQLRAATDARWAAE